MVWYGKVRSSVVRYGMMWHHMVRVQTQYGMTQYGIMQNGIVDVVLFGMYDGIVFFCMYGWYCMVWVD